MVLILFLIFNNIYNNILSTQNSLVLCGHVLCCHVRFSFDCIWPPMLVPPKPSDPCYALGAKHIAGVSNNRQKKIKSNDWLKLLYITKFVSVLEIKSKSRFCKIVQPDRIMSYTSISTLYNVQVRTDCTGQNMSWIHVWNFIRCSISSPNQNPGDAPD